MYKLIKTNQQPWEVKMRTKLDGNLIEISGWAAKKITCSLSKDTTFTTIKETEKALLISDGEFQAWVPKTAVKNISVLIEEKKQCFKKYHTGKTLQQITEVIGDESESLGITPEMAYAWITEDQKTNSEVKEIFSMIDDPSGTSYTYEDLLDQVRECPGFSNPDEVSFIGDQGTKYTGQELLDLVGMENDCE
jgi:hypothetical protein